MAKMTKNQRIVSIMNLISVVYVDESVLNQSVKSSLSKLDKDELDRLHLMIETSK